MKKTKILFRADGNSRLGFGHIMRTLALGEHLNSDFICEFATRFVSDYIRKEIKKVCTAIHILSEEEHLDSFLKLLVGNEIVVLDNYFFTEEYQRQIKNKGCKLVCIDDLFEKHFVSDIVINHAPEIDAGNYSCEPYTRLCLGFQYALLRKPFLTSSPRKKNKNLNHALICFGGTDKDNLTLKTTRTLSEHENIKILSVITTSSYQFDFELQNLKYEIDNQSELKLYKDLSSEELVEVFNQVDFAVVPSSTILFEVLSQNLPVISGYYVENQKIIASRLKDKFPDILIVGDISNTQILHGKVDILRENIKGSRNSPLIDSSVPKRLLKVFKLLESEMSIVTRRAKSSDVDTYFNWANDTITRQNSLNPEQITYNEHIKWFKNKLESNTDLLVFEKDQKPIGQVRFEFEMDSAVINYSVAPEFRGKGFGFVILKLAIQELTESKNIILKKVIGVVKKNNFPSNKLFEQLNFSIVSEDSDSFTYSKDL